MARCKTRCCILRRGHRAKDATPCIDSLGHVLRAVEAPRHSRQRKRQVITSNRAWLRNVMRRAMQSGEAPDTLLGSEERPTGGKTS